MGSGIQGGGLTGGPARATSVVAPSGQSAILVGPLGAGATDVVTKDGSSVADGTVNATAKLLSIRTGIGGTEVEKLWVFKGGTIGSASGVFRGASPINGFLQSDDGIGAIALNYATQRLIITAANLTIDDNSTGLAALTVAATSGLFSQKGTDSTGTPGAAVIDKPTGKSSIAAGAASVLITNSLCAATSRVMITVHARDATCLLIIAVPAAGSFTVSGTAAATADLPFSWEVSNIL